MKRSGYAAAEASSVQESPPGSIKEGLTLPYLPQSEQGSLTDLAGSLHSSALFPNQPKIPILTPNQSLGCEGREAEEESEQLQVAQEGRECFFLYFSGLS